MILQKTKILLILDNCMTHPKKIKYFKARIHNLWPAPGKKISRKPLQKIAGISDYINIFFQNTCVGISTFHKTCIKPLNELHISSKKPTVHFPLKSLQKPSKYLKNHFFFKVFCWFFYLGRANFGLRSL